jgi:hypothetical protein
VETQLFPSRARTKWGAISPDPEADMDKMGSSGDFLTSAWASIGIGEPPSC